jgi:hypothetical protein
MPTYSTDHISGEDRRHENVLPHHNPGRLVTRRLFIDSRHASVYAPFEFTTKLDNDISRDRYKNIVSVELKAATIPKLTGEDYVILDIDELRDSNIDSSVPSLNDGFALCFFDNSSLASGDVKVIDKIFNQRAVFNPPVNIDKLTVRIKKHDGNVVSPSETANSNNVSLLFDVTMIK